MSFKINTFALKIRRKIMNLIFDLREIKSIMKSPLFSLKTKLSPIMQACEQHILLFKAAKVFEVDRVI